MNPPKSFFRKFVRVSSFYTSRATKNGGQTLQGWMKRKEMMRNAARRISNTLSEYRKQRRSDSPKVPAASMALPLNRLTRPERSESGMASLVATVVLISLLSAVAVAFSVIMNRELQKSVNNQLGQAAYNAAASGINDAISYLRDNPNTNVTQCADLLGPGKPLSLAANLSGDGSTKYTCALINSKPYDLVYQSVTSNQSQVIRTSFSATAGKLMVSWQASNRAYNNFVPAIQAGQLFDETAWNSAKYTPMLKVSLYPIPADTKDAASALADSRTYYLYPIKPSGFSVNTMSWATGAGSLKPVECGLKNNNGAFNGSADYDCNLIITDLPTANPAGYMYYVRMTPTYGTADVKIRANDATLASTELSFVGTQAIIDVTAQSAGVVKRLQARVDTSGLNGISQNMSAGDNAFPEYALRAANTACKRLQSPGSLDFPVYIDDSSINYCGSDLGGIQKLKPPVVSINCSPTGQNSGSCSGSVNPNNGKITACTLTNSDGQSTTCATNPLPSTTAYGVSWSIGGLSAGTGYTVTLCATNPAGQNCTNSGFTTESPPPAPPPQVITITVSPLWNASISDNGSGAGLAQCEFYQGGSSASPGPFLETASISAAYGFSVMNYGSTTSPGSPAPAGTSLIHCLGVSGVSQWSDAPAAPGMFLKTYLHGVWDAGNNGHCDNSVAPEYRGLWYCRFNPNVVNIVPCADGVHRWVTCMNDPRGSFGVAWEVTGGSGAVTCTGGTRAGYGVFVSDVGSVYQTPGKIGWGGDGSPNPGFYLTCTDSTGPPGTTWSYPDNIN